MSSTTKLARDRGSTVLVCFIPPPFAAFGTICKLIRCHFLNPICHAVKRENDALLPAGVPALAATSRRPAEALGRPAEEFAQLRPVGTLQTLPNGIPRETLGFPIPFRVERHIIVTGE